MTILLSFIFFFSFFLPVFFQPLSLGVAIMILRISISLFIGFIGFSIFGFILFLVFVGGLLVMFGYVIVLIPNMSFGLSSYFFLFLFFPAFLWSDFDFFFSGLDFGFLFRDFGFLLYLGLALILLFCLIVVVKVCYFHSGSLRPFFSY